MWPLKDLQNKDRKVHLRTWSLWESSLEIWQCLSWVLVTPLFFLLICVFPVSFCALANTSNTFANAFNTLPSKSLFLNYFFQLLSTRSQELPSLFFFVDVHFRIQGVVLSAKYKERQSWLMHSHLCHFIEFLTSV